MRGFDSNRATADYLDKLADLLAKSGEKWKSRAFQKAASMVRYYEMDIERVGNPQEIEFVGPSAAREIKQFLTFGSSDRIRRLQAKFGEDVKKDNRIERSLAESLGHPVVAVLQEVSDRVPFAGSIRRKKATIRDIDIVVAGKPEVILDVLANNPLLKASGVVVLGGGVHKVRLNYTFQDRQVGGDIVITNLEEWGAALNYLTGSKEFNIAVRGFAKARGFRINEHCATRTEDGKKIPIREEEDLFKLLGIPFIEPEDRVGPSAL